jgi:hypothetical protein
VSATAAINRILNKDLTQKNLKTKGNIISEQRTVSKDNENVIAETRAWPN